MTSPLLEVRGLKKHFFENEGLFGRSEIVYALDGVSFSLNEGQTLGLVGESGCGKTTLGRTLMKLYDPTEGQVIFNSTDITNLSNSKMRLIRKDMQMIFQDPFSSLNPRMTVSSLVGEPFLIHETNTRSQVKSKVAELLELVGLDPVSASRRYPHEFSGGQRQRIGIARAIALNPKLVIADEPVSALDVSIQSQILNLMAKLKKTLKLSYVFIAHDLAVVEHISDVVAVMYLGKIVEYADSEVLYKNPLHPYTKILIDSIPVPEVGNKRRRAVIKGDVPSPLHPPSGCSFHPRCPLATNICREKSPEMKSYSNDQSKHDVACHHV